MLDLGSVQLSETNRSLPENGWLEDEFPFGTLGLFSGRTISFREGNVFKQNKVFKEKIMSPYILVNY